METKFVIKRDGQIQNFDYAKISSSIYTWAWECPNVLPRKIYRLTFDKYYSGITTMEICNKIAETAASLIPLHEDYGSYAAYVKMWNIYKNIHISFTLNMRKLYNNVEDVTHRPKPLISENIMNIINSHAFDLEPVIVPKRDFDFDYFQICTLEESYLLKLNNKIMESPQHMFMRVAVLIHGNKIPKVIETFNYLSKHILIHAFPTLSSACTVEAQMASSYLLSPKGQSINDIFDTFADCTTISTLSGGIGTNMHKLPTASNNNGHGIISMLRIFNDAAHFVNQINEKRTNPFAIYLEPWHADIFDFLDLKKTEAYDLRYGIWMPDLFMRRVQNDENWSLMCPKICPNLDDVWGEKFDELYQKYELENRAIRIIKARTLWRAIIDTQIKTGMPYIMYKDSCNAKSNQKHLGTIKNGNLCTETVAYCSPDETASCCLASIALPKFVDKTTNSFNFEELRHSAYILAENLNSILHKTCYPVTEATTTICKHHPIGIGVQGLADTFILLRYPYESDEARLLNKQIFETIYYGAIEASINMAQCFSLYSSYINSPISQGIFQFDMWDAKYQPTDLWDWQILRDKVKKYGIYNSLLIAAMPTNSTAKLFGNTESFEPIKSNILRRHFKSGDYYTINKYLIDDLKRINLWTYKIRDAIIANHGNINNITKIPQNIRNLYKTVWDISVYHTIDMAAERGAFIDQSQAFNIYLANPSYDEVSSIHLYAWSKGLKTGMYYLRTQSTDNICTQV